MNSAKQSRFSAFLRHNGPAVLLAAGLFLLTYQIVLGGRRDFLSSDYAEHAAWAVQMTGRQMLAAFYDGRPRLWHICVRLVMLAGVNNLWRAAALVTAAADAAACFLVYKCWDRALPERTPRWLLALAVTGAFLAASLTLPGHSFYTGRGAVNTWHNPTNIMVRPFAAAVFYMTVNIYDRRRYGRHTLLPPMEELSRPFAFTGGFWAQFRLPVFTRTELALYPLCLLLSAYAKPSFLQFFAPAILLFLLADVLRTRGMLLPFCLKLALAFLPAGLVILGEYFRFFSHGFGLAAPAAAGTAGAAGTAKQASVLVYFVKPSFSGPGEAAGQVLSSLVQTLYPCAFPLFILLVCPRRLRDTASRLGFVGLVIGRLEHLFLHETGSRAAHGNFSWGYYVAVWLLWTVAIGLYAELWHDRSAAGRLARWGGTALLGWHLACGVGYVCHILQTAQFLI